MTSSASIARRLDKLEAALQPDQGSGLAAALEAMRTRQPRQPRQPEQLAARIAELQAQADACAARGRVVPDLLAGLLGMLQVRQRATGAA